MTNTWMCLWAKHLPYFQSRLLSSSAYYFQSRGNVIPADVACLANLPEDDLNYIFRSVSQISAEHHLGSTINGKSKLGRHSSKCDLFSSLCWPLGAKNQELINSLRKIVQPVKYDEAIHVTKSSVRVEGYTDNFVGVLSDFHALDEPFNKDLLLMQTRFESNVAMTEGVYKSTDGNISEGKDDDNERKGPSIAQLEEVKQYYIEIAPTFMRRGERWKDGRHDENIVFENYLRKKPKITVGLSRYLFELAKIRVYAVSRYPSCYLRIQSINIHPQNGYVKIHWNAIYSTNSQLLSWIASAFGRANPKKKYTDTLEAISTIYVNSEGKIVKHVVDRRIPIEDENLSTVKNLAAKTVGMVGLSPKASIKGQKNGAIS